MKDDLVHFLGQYRLLVIVFVLILAALGAFFIWRGLQRPQATGSGQPIPTAGSGNTSLGGVFPASSSSTTQIDIQLSEGKPQPQAAGMIPAVAGEPLPPGQAAQLLSRLPTLPVDPSAQTGFKLPQGPVPPPRTGETTQQAFPPPPGPTQPPPASSSAGPLQVLRYSPEGEIPIAPFVNITFNQAMIPVGSLSDLAAAQVPVQMSPALPGTWRWLGTRTLNFQYDSSLIDRLPMATAFKVTIPAGTKSATGSILEKAVEWSFSTPAPKVVSSYPGNDPQPLNPLFFITFDQRVDPAAVLNTVHVTAGSQTVSLALADQTQIQADEQGKILLKNVTAGRWIAFRAKEPLPAGTTVSVAVGPGTPSAEGSLVTKTVQTYTFRTYSALKIEDHGCSYGDNPCQPLTPFFIRFNNPIDPKTYTSAMLKVDPTIPGVSTSISGDTLTIQGETKGQTTYNVTVDGSIQDTFGQKLGQTATLTFKVGPATPRLVGPGQTFITLDPASTKPIFSVYSLNFTSLALKIYAVQPSDWPGFIAYQRNWQQSGGQTTVPGRLVLDKSLPVEAPADTLSQVDIDLSQVMDGSFGQFIVIVAPPEGLFKNNQDLRWQTVQAWVQVTQIGLDAFSDQSDLVAWATVLKDGHPLGGVTIKAGAADWQTTGPDGTARGPIPSGAIYLVASQGADQAILPRNNGYYDDTGWTAFPQSDELRWYVFDDRQMYKPGEDVHVKGWLRRIGAGKAGDVGLVGQSVTGVNYQVMESQGNIIGSGRADVNALGGFDFTFTVPQAVNLGSAYINFNAEGSLDGVDNGEYSHSFQIEEFRRPDYEVVARNETTGPYFGGGKAVVAVQASYYAGGPLPNADVTWQVTSSPSNYSPPNWPDFTFGTWQPWWWGGEFNGPMIGPGGPVGPDQSKAETFSGKTDASGTHYLNLDFALTGDPKPVSIVAEATVMDVNRQAWTGTTTLLVHPADLYVGLRSDRYFVQKGVPIQIELIVTDLDGKAKAGQPVDVRAVRLDYRFVNGTWQTIEVDAQTCAQNSAATPVACTFQTPTGGTYQITATVTDEQGRKNQSQITRWVSGGSQPPARNVEQEKATLIPDKDSYNPGDVAQILVQSPFSPAEGLLTVSRSGIISTQRFQIQDGTAVLKVPVEDKDIPNLNIQVDLNGAAPRTDDSGSLLKGAPPRPAFASGQLNLRISLLTRTLSLQVTPYQADLEPGGQTNLTVVVKDASGKPVAGAELAAVVVDEAILALSNYQMADPLQAFYLDRPSNVSSVYARSSIILANPLSVAGAGARTLVTTGGGALDKFAQSLPAAAPAATMAPAEAGNAPHQPGQQPSTIRVRSDFNPLALFAAAVKTDANGQARIQVKVPDNLTRYRVMVVAVDQGQRFGYGESHLTARLPLMVRPSAPRFLNFGDAFDLPVVLQNQTDQPLDVSVAVRASNLNLTGPSGLRVTVPPNDRVEVRFPATTDMAGTATIQVAAESGSFADAATVQLPVYTPATTEAFATYGVLDSGSVVQPVAAPTGVFPQYGGLEVSTSSTALQSLTDAVVYLVNYPYECSEQLASRILAVSALKDVLTAFQSGGLPAPNQMEAAVQHDITALQGMQNSDGGFPYWRSGDDTIPFNTIHVAHALAIAKTKGFDVPQDMTQKTLEYLRQIESHYPAWYSSHTRQILSAYALYVRSLYGDRDTAKASRLLKEAGIDNLGLDALGWIWPVINDPAQLDSLRRYASNHAVETAGTANFTTNYDDQNYLLLGSDRRTDAILLNALIGDNPQSDLIPKLVNGLLAQRVRGRWGSTQENVFVLLALDKYFNTFEAQTPDFVARIWLGDGYAGDHTYQGRTTDRQDTSIPMAYLQDQASGGTQNLTISKDGTGRLYYRVGMSYAPADLIQGPLDMGFVVQRTYEAVDDPKDVTRDSNGIWHIRAGVRVRVHITVVADDRRYHVALVDPLPAGLEIVNPDLAVSGSLPQDPNSPDAKYGWWWSRSWFEHENMRDDRAEAFASLLWDGVYQYTYVARATTPGRYVVPPAKAEEMYSPEVFGRSGSDVVIVE